MNKYIGMALAAFALAGCETTESSTANFDVKSLPERALHTACLKAKVQEYSRVEGSPLELGQIASSGCNSTRYALYDAIAKHTNKYFAKGYIGASETEDPKMVAAAIIKTRGH
ncbi:hypothetical protein [Rhizobium mongolense]|nr:hypothetical protein [Rhizobium mongolense]MBB4230052.1 hypothetical protein [Rhizobium mongolense]